MLCLLVSYMPLADYIWRFVPCNRAQTPRETGARDAAVTFRTLRHTVQPLQPRRTTASRLPLRCSEATADSHDDARRKTARARRARLSTSCEGKAYAGAMTKVVCTLGPATEKRGTRRAGAVRRGHGLRAAEF